MRAVAFQDADFDETAHDFFDEQGIAACAFENPAAQPRGCFAPLETEERREQLLPVGKQLLRLRADDFVLKNLRKSPVQFPRTEERTPIDKRHDLLERHWIKNLRA